MTSVSTCALLLVALLGTPMAWAHGYKVGSIEIEHPWSRATVAAASTGVVYLTLRNNGKDADRLVGLSTPVATRAELHATTYSGDVMRMRKIDAVDVSAGARIELKPSGVHVMLLGLKQPLVKGKAFPVTLMFENAGPVTVQAEVQGLTDNAPGHSSPHHEGHSH